MANIQTIISDLEYGRSQLLNAIEGLSQRELTQIPIYENWTIKDVLAHIIGWDQRTLQTLPLMLQDRAGEIAGVEVEAHNLESVAIWQDKPLTEVLAALKSTHRQILDILAAVDHVEIDLRRQRNGRVITIRSYVIDVMMEHDRKHALEIEQWRKDLEQNIGLPAIKARLIQNQANFWTVLEGLEEAELIDKSAVDGWSIKDVAGHIADWEELILKAAYHIYDPSEPPVDVIEADVETVNALLATRRANNTWLVERKNLREIQRAFKEFVDRLKPGDCLLRGPYPWPDDRGSLAELIQQAAEHYTDHLPDLERWRQRKLMERFPGKPWLPWVVDEAATGLLKHEYEAAVSRAGKVWHIVRAMSLNPAALQAAMQLDTALVRRSSRRLGRAEREMIAVVVSQVNECPYSIQAHLHDLRIELDDDELVDRFAADWRTAGLPPHTMAALTLAEKITRTPNQVRQDDLRELRRVGFADPDIHDIVQIAAYFNYINRVADGLGVPPEDFMVPWPREDGGW